jgi:hypothetical protein
MTRYTRRTYTRTRRTRAARDAAQTRSARMAFVRLVVLLGGMFYLLIGISMLVQPEWFFENAGTFPPYNRHYLGDLGSFLLPLGAGLIIASQDPARYRVLISIGAAGSIIHSFNHWYEVTSGAYPLAFWFTDTLPLLAFAAIFFWALWQVRPRLVR